ncbi:hypothetical protein POJ06DRAFT_271718 [Lipomyces tetrasporus]|uniref:Uncharacterized protein n=1 Tax=Lipomyces tetrasporus TaxID=54092 RepID=A0AAD7QKU5_9ASCO|nr:uncharacterized protein POJ06DRAFT_271718 [Lipomyces tetrasporus]KAJ8096696.1 hypothetical protein POJ06DRAFT_271718 [Lipomyces tetrasporus]
MSNQLPALLTEGDDEAQLLAELGKAPKAMPVIGRIREFWESRKRILALIGLGLGTVIGLAFIILGVLASSDRLFSDRTIGRGDFRQKDIASICMNPVISICGTSMQYILKRAELVRNLRPAMYLKRSAPVDMFVKCSFSVFFVMAICAIPLALGSITFVIEGLDSSKISSFASVTLGMSLMIMSTMCILAIVRTHTQGSSIRSPDEDAETTRLLEDADYDSKENHSIKTSDPWHSTKRIIARVFVCLSPVVGTAFFIIGAVGATEKLSEYCSAHVLVVFSILLVIGYCLLSMQFIMRHPVLKVDLQSVPGLKKSAPMDRIWVSIYFYFFAPVATFGATLMTFGIEGEDAPPIMNAASMALGISLVIHWAMCSWCTRYHLTTSE